jgi:hypothetical protein
MRATRAQSILGSFLDENTAGVAVFLPTNETRSAAWTEPLASGILLSELETGLQEVAR